MAITKEALNMASEQAEIETQLRLAREVELNGGFYIDNSVYDYVLALGGLKGFFEYIRSLDCKLILDIGAGNTKGVAEIAESPLGRGLDFKATGLVEYDEIKNYLGNDNFNLTSSEALDGIPNDSVGGIIGLASFAYTASPRMVVDSIDRVLVPGGVVKAVLRSCNRDEWGLNKRVKSKSGEDFRAHFEKKGYKVLVGTQPRPLERDILLAIKSGGNPNNLTPRPVLKEPCKTRREMGLL